jgi:signal transduction histidine kinase/CheY-like chemotaxis protein
MRIASALIIALTLSALGGLSVATLINSGYHSLRDLEEIAGRNSVVSARIRGFRNAAEQALVSADLVVGSNIAYLAPGAIKQIDRLLVDVGELRDLSLVDTDQAAFTRVVEALEQVKSLVNAGAAGSQNPPASLSLYDAAAAELVSLISGLEKTIQQRASAARDRVEAEDVRRHRVDILLLCAYSLLMVLVLLALLRQIAGPVLRLTVNAEDAIELGHRFRPGKRGPSEIRQLGETIARLVGDLESKVAERTAALKRQADELRAEIRTRQRVEAQLRSTILVAEAANQAKSEFLSVISHELRTPMNAVLGTLTLLSDKNLDSEQRVYIQTARDSGEALMSLLNDVLDMSKIEAGGLELVDREFDLPESIDHVVSLFHPKCCSKLVVLAGIIAPDVPRVVRGDPLRIRQVLTNLVGNAVKFTDDGHIHLAVKTVTDTDGQRFVEFSVEDTGIGIAEDDQGEVFSNFTQVDKSYTRKYGGSGLGLAISKRLVESMGGRIGVESEPGSGSRFWFTVPSDHGDSGAEDSVEALRRRLADRHILIAGSCYSLAETLRRILDGWAASVTVARHAEQLAAAMERLPDGSTAVVCGSPDTIAWSQAATQVANCPHPLKRVAIVPCVAEAGKIARDSGSFDVVHDEALKPLTIMRAACGDDPVPADVRIEDEATPASGRILLVEDSAANRLVASAILEKAGYTVYIAENGEEAVNTARDYPPDVILMDLQMPVMNGYDSARAIRTLPGVTGRVPIIALTANVMARSEATGRAVTLDGYISKPYSRKVLLETVRHHLERAGSSREG